MPRSIGTAIRPFSLNQCHPSLGHDAVIRIQTCFTSWLTATKLMRAPKSSSAHRSLDSSFESKMPSDLRTSYLQVFSVHSARPPKQLEHPRHWVLQLRCGQDYWVFQQCLKHRLRQLFVFVPSNLPLSFCEASQAGGIRKDLGMRTRAWAEISAILG